MVNPIPLHCGCFDIRRCCSGRASYLAATGFLFLLPPPDRVTNDAEFVSDRRQCFLLRHKYIFARGGGSERNGQLPAPKLIESSFS